MFPHTNVDTTRSGIEKQVREMLALVEPLECSRIERKIKNFCEISGTRRDNVRLRLTGPETPLFDYVIEQIHSQ